MQLNRSSLKNFPPVAPIGTAGDIFIHILLSLITRIYNFIKKIENFSIILSKKRKFFNFLPAKVPLIEKLSCLVHPPRLFLVHPRDEILATGLTLTKYSMVTNQPIK